MTIVTMMQFLASSSIISEKQFFRDDKGESFRNVGLQVELIEAGRPRFCYFQPS